MDVNRQFDFAKEAIAQVITLAAAILALSVTFSSGWADQATGSEKVLLKASWCLLVVSLLGGLFALLGLAGIAYRGRGDIRTTTVRVPWLVQLVAFFLGLGLLLAFGLRVV
ncbi:hypothetical protein GCM10009841_04590 [Microlunatus panaciterrae]